MSVLISIIAAIQKTDRALGKNNQLLFRISEDLQRFKQITSGHPIIMGRKTFESIGRALPNRTNIIISRNKNYKQNNCIISHSIEDAIIIAKKHDQKEIFIIGGSEIYTQAIHRADKLYLTIVEGNYSADVFFPEYSDFNQIIFKEDHVDSNPAYTFLVLIR